MKKVKRLSMKSVVFTFLVIGVLTGVYTGILWTILGFDALPAKYIILITVYWLLVSMAFTLFVNIQIRERYEKPMERIASAISQVVNGDFSVYVSPEHAPDKQDYLDKMIMDFNKMVEELGSIETLKTDFVSNVSHEIKTPLAVISNYVQLLQSDKTSEEEKKEYLKELDDSIGKLSALISNIARLNRLEKQNITPVSESYDVCRQLCDCALGFEMIWEKKNIELEADIEDRAMVTADESFMELVWNNLISNAVKFTDPGGKVVIRQTSTEREVIVTIEDSGCGMSEETRKHIFEKFYQGDTSRAKEGNGLGLALVQRILQLTDGSITVESELGQGSLFTVRIPVSKARKEKSNA